MSCFFVRRCRLFTSLTLRGAALTTDAVVNAGLTTWGGEEGWGGGVSFVGGRPGGFTLWGLL